MVNQCKMAHLVLWGSLKCLQKVQPSSSGSIYDEEEDSEFLLLYFGHLRIVAVIYIWWKKLSVMLTWNQPGTSRKGKQIPQKFLVFLYSSEQWACLPLALCQAPVQIHSCSFTRSKKKEEEEKKRLLLEGSWVLSRRHHLAARCFGSLCAYWYVFILLDFFAVAGVQRRKKNLCLPSGADLFRAVSWFCALKCSLDYQFFF